MTTRQTPNQPGQRLGYLGPSGTLAEEAAEHFARRLEVPLADLVPCSSVPASLDLVQAGDAAWAVVPAENSTEGSVGLTWDYLLFSPGLTITGEMVLPVVHHLLGQRGQSLATISTVLSHPQALGQCRNFLKDCLPQAKQYETASTAEAARVVSVNQLPLAAIGQERAARRYGLDILAFGIQDVKENATRFLLVTKTDSPGQDAPTAAPPTGRDRTSLACTLERDRSGGLHRMLGHFAARGLNLSRIESRPARKQLGDYVFFIDVEGHLSDSALAAALEELKDDGSLLRVLGSYPRGDMPVGGGKP